MDSSPAKPRRRLLLVEDEPELLQMLHQHFTSLGHEVAATPNGAAALKLVIESDFDVVICDMVMPRLSGNMFFYAVKKVKPALCDRFVFITGHGESPGVREFLVGMSDRVISKPFNLEDLVGAVREVVESRGPKAAVLGGA